jgi:hypothetical protein
MYRIGLIDEESLPANIESPASWDKIPTDSVAYKNHIGLQH